MPLNYQYLIRQYSTGLAKGSFDTDLTPRQRRITEVLLNLASNAGAATYAYPPDDATRDSVLRHLGNIIWEARSLVVAASPRSADDFETAVGRTIEILRSM